MVDAVPMEQPYPNRCYVCEDGEFTRGVYSICLSCGYGWDVDRRGDYELVLMIAAGDLPAVQEAEQGLTPIEEGSTDT